MTPAALASIAAGVIALAGLLGILAPARASLPWVRLAALGYTALVAAAVGGAPLPGPGLAALGTALLLGLAVALLAPEEGDAPSRLGRMRFFLVPLLVYVALVPWSTQSRPPNGDEPWYLLMAHSLAFDQDLDLANNYAAQDSLRFMQRAIEPQQGDRTLPDGRMLSHHARFLPMLLAVPYALGGAPGTQVFMALLAAALCLAFHRLCQAHFPSHARGARLTATLLALSPPLLFFSHQIWVEVPAALLATAFLLLLTRVCTRPTPGGVAVLALCALFLPLLKTRFALVSATLLALAVVRLRKHQPRLALTLGAVAGLAVAAAAVAAFDRGVLGGHGVGELMIFQRSAGELVRGALGPFFDVAFGLFFCAPIWMLLLVAVPRASARLLREVAWLCLPYLVLLASRQEWYGGWSPPFRYGLVLLPILALLLVPLLDRRLRATSGAVVSALLLASVALTLLHVAVPGWSYNVADGRSHLLDHASRAFGTDVSRLFPSYTRPRVAAWVWPPILILALHALWQRGARASVEKATAWGVAVPLVLVGVSPFGLERMPTQRIDVEAPYVEHFGHGHREPERWVTDRLRYPESWILREYEVLEAPVRPGGASVRLRVRMRLIQNHPGQLTLRVLPAAGAAAAAEIATAQHDVWREVEVGPLPWSSSTLRLELVPDEPGRDGVMNGLALDWIDLRWE